MTNFDFLKSEPQFSSFADVAIAAETVLHIDAATAVINCRRAAEFAVKWLYSVDDSLVKPYDDKLSVLMNTEEFRHLVKSDIWQRLEFIRKAGNVAAHNNRKTTKDQAKLCLENLYIFLDFIAYCYAKNYIAGSFDYGLLDNNKSKSAVSSVADSDVSLDSLISKNKELKKEFTARREKQEVSYVPKPLDISEYSTRKIYIDTMLIDAGWIEGNDWINEVELIGMPNKSETGFADYVLYGKDGRVLAVVEAKRTCVDISKGRKQAELYADILEKQHGRRPVIFLTNGFETRIIDGQYPERKVAAIYSKRDLEKLFNLRSERKKLTHIMINREIAGRYYQEAAIRSVCDSFDGGNRRKALLVMATGAGKTRTVIELCNILLQRGWVRNILFLADRNTLVRQAKRSFVNLLPDLQVTNLVEDKKNFNARCVFSTYQTMINCIDSVKDENGKLFTCGHFDLIICDEAHRSIYNKYQDIFNYFDALLVGLTATPKDDIDKNTYDVFQLQNGVPTYGYELAQAVKDGFLVDYFSIESKLKFIEEGIVYDDLSDEDKAEYEKTFEGEDGEIPESISSSTLNEWVFNEDTIRKVLNILWDKGLRIDYGENLGKTIIFAKNHRHAEKILEVFGKEYPSFKDYAQVVDNYINYAQTIIDDFSIPNKLPQIAISVDMLDTGVDVPEVLNLVFFKKVMSKAKFWQMIGRGTRLCPNLIDGKDKEHFYIFDFCGNFEFFRLNDKGKAAINTLALQSSIFNLKAQIISKLQDIAYQTDELRAFRSRLVEEMSAKVQELNKENFAVIQHLKYVEIYSNTENYNILTYEDTLVIKEELSPLILPDDDEVSAVRFDALIYGIELAYLVGKKYKRARNDLCKSVSAIAEIANIPEIMAHSELINKILHTDYLDNADVGDFENIREKLRGLMKFIPASNRHLYETNFDDDILSIDWRESELESNDLKDYKMKAEYYVRQHQDNPVIAKLKSNIPLTTENLRELEKILWSDLGTKKDYEAQYGQKPLGEFVREIVGLDMVAAKKAFADYLDNTDLDSRQIYFVNQIVEYIVRNGMMKNLSVLTDTPFTDKGTISEIFKDLSVWEGIKKTISQINANAGLM